MKYVLKKWKENTKIKKYDERKESEQSNIIIVLDAQEVYPSQINLKLNLSKKENITPTLNCMEKFIKTENAIKQNTLNKNLRNITNRQNACQATIPRITFHISQTNGYTNITNKYK